MRRAFSLVVLAVAFMVAQAFTGVSLSHAQTTTTPSNPCLYPPSRPVMRVVRTTPRRDRTRPYTFRTRGRLTHNGCALAGQKVGMFTRRRGSSGPFVFRRATTTSASGAWAFRYRVRRSQDMVFIFSGDKSFSRGVSRRVRARLVRRSGIRQVIISR